MMGAGQVARWRTVWLAALVISLAGCQSSKSWVDSYYTGEFDARYSADARLSGSDEPEFFSESGVQACLVGASLGALACLFVSGEERASCMAVAATAGCAVGSTTNYVLDDRRAKYANAEQRMQIYIHDVEADSRLLEQRMSTYEVVLKDNRAELDRIRRDIQQKRGNERVHRQQLMEMQANRKIMTDELAGLDKKIEQYRVIAMEESRQGVRSAEFLSALQSLENERNDLQRLIEQTYQDLPAIVASS